MELQWIKCGPGDRYCHLELVNLGEVTCDGVYIIWNSSSGKVIRIGQGDIRQRLQSHRLDPNILVYRGGSTLLVTWAEVPAHEIRLQIERYLDRIFAPIVPTNAPPGSYLQVNLP